MTSAVDVTIPADNVKADKSAFRTNFATISSEITSLQRITNTPYQIAFGDKAFSFL